MLRAFLIHRDHLRTGYPRTSRRSRTQRALYGVWEDFTLTGVQNARVWEWLAHFESMDAPND